MGPSVHDQLEVASAELQRSAEEFARAHSDLENLLAATGVPTLLLDRDLRVTKVTPAARSLFRLLDEDTGRPIGELTPRLPGEDLLADVAEMQRTLRPIEREVETDERECFLRRVLPFCTGDSGVSGAVITLVNVTPLKRALDAVRSSAEAERKSATLLRAIADGIPDPVFVKDLQGRMLLANPAALALYGKPAEQVLGRSDVALFETETAAALMDTDRRIMAAGEAVAIEERVRTTSGLRWFLSTKAPFRDECGKVAGIVGVSHDITERKHAEDALRESEERFRALVTASSDVVYRMSPDWTEMLELHGREFIADTEAPSRSWLDRYIHPDDQPHVTAVIAEAIRTRSTFQLEHRVLRVDGSLGWTFSRAIPLFDASGALVEWFGAASDVTRRKEAEESLRASEERFRLLVQQVSDYAIYMLTPDGAVTSWSAAAEKMFGYREDEILGHHRAILFTEEDRRAGKPQRHLDEAASTGKSEDESWRVRKDGSRLWVNVLVTPVRDDLGHLRGFANVTRDFTERRKGEEDLRAKEARLRLAQEIARVGTFDWDLRTGVNTWTPELEAMYGLPRGGFPRTEEAWEQLVHPDDRAEAIRRVRLAFETGAQMDGDWRVIWPDGSVHWIAGRWQVVKDALGCPVRVTGINIDVTDRKRAEELRASEAALREADRQKNQFLAMLSHELRNPLAPIRNSLYILERAAPGGEQARRAQGIIERQIGQLTWLIDDLLDVTRITRGKIRLQRARLDLNELAQRVVEDHRTLFAKSEVRVEVRPARAEVWVDADRGRLTQAIGNLLQNAAKFTPRGGKATVAVETDRARARAALTVRDTGVGIDPGMLPRLFQPFAQADATLDRSKGGLGLGLALVKGLVEMHGGSVEAASDGPGQGAAFTIRLPLDVGGARAAPAQPRLEPRASPRRILVIEDNEDAAETMREVLELGGHAVEVAYDGPEGLEKARASHPDVVLCDIGLPKMDGYQVARAMRADPEVGGVALIAVSGYAQPEDVAMAKEAGFDAHLAKPPSVDMLERTIAEVDGAGA